jgi:uncharacterized membrane-anchored protein YhcB (DUF1043 family)
MFWVGVLIGLFAGTMIGFLAAGLCGMMARQDSVEELPHFPSERYRLQCRDPNCREYS